MSADPHDAQFAAKSNPTTVTDSPVTDPGSSVKASHMIILFVNCFRIVLTFNIPLILIFESNDRKGSLTSTFML